MKNAAMWENPERFGSFLSNNADLSFFPHSLVTYSNVPACKFAYEFYGNFTYIGKIAQFPALSNNVTTSFI